MAQHVKVNRYVSTSIDDARTDQIFTDARQVLVAKDGPDDVSCDVDLRRDGDVTTFNAGNGVINSKADMEAVCATGGYVHLVREINWCGISMPNIIGCSNTPGACMIIVRYDASMEGILWAHEYGHTKGLNHRSDANAVMNPVIGVTHRRINAAECAAYKASAATSEPSPGTPQAAESTSAKMNIKDFVHQVFIHGIAPKDVSMYTSTEAAELVPLLQDPKEEPYWANIVAVLCMTSDKEVTPKLGLAAKLIALFNSGKGALSAGNYAAKKAVLVDLGYLINRTGDKEAMNFLKDFAQSTVSPAVTADSWVAPSGLSSDELNVNLKQLAVWGLVYSGRPEAEATIRTLKENKSTMSVKISADFYDDALKELAKVRDMGLESYTSHR